MMRLGFVGTGEITSAMVRGLCASGDGAHSIQLSPRNARIAADLASRFAGVSIAPSNQAVLDSCDTIVIAVRPQVVRRVLSELRFRPEHRVISVVSSFPLRTVFDLVAPAARVTRAVPLPATAQKLGPTLIYPADPDVGELFAPLGSVFTADTENEFNAFCASAATVASYFALLDRIASWLAGNGVSESKARDYIAQLFWGVTTVTVRSPERSFQSLASNHATSGGINEQFLRHLVEAGLLEKVSEGLEAVLHRIRTASQTL